MGGLNIMTKKQCGIIFTLLALIICTGVLATKLNNEGLNDQSNVPFVTANNIINNENDEDTETLNQQQNQFYEAKSEREQQNSSTIQNLNAIIADANTSQEQKDEATKELTKKTMVIDNEGRIELNIKNKCAIDDVLCMLEDSKATVIVKSATGLEEADSVAIQEIVEDVSNVKDVVIEVQK